MAIRLNQTRKTRLASNAGKMVTGNAIAPRKVLRMVVLQLVGVKPPM